MDEFLSFSIQDLFNIIKENKEWLFSGIGILVLVNVGKFLFNFFSVYRAKRKPIKETLLNTKIKNLRNQNDMAKLLQIDEIMQNTFPEYKDYLLIQYGSSVRTDVVKPNDYDFIVLLLDNLLIILKKYIT